MAAPKGLYSNTRPKCGCFKTMFRSVSQVPALMPISCMSMQYQAPSHVRFVVPVIKVLMTKLNLNLISLTDHS